MSHKLTMLVWLVSLRLCTVSIERCRQLCDPVRALGNMGGWSRFPLVGRGPGSRFRLLPKDAVRQDDATKLAKFDRTSMSYPFLVSNFPTADNACNPYFAAFFRTIIFSQVPTKRIDPQRTRLQFYLIYKYGMYVTV